MTSAPPNRFILGLMTFGPPPKPGDTAINHAKITNLDDFNKCLDFFQSHGYNEVDTSRVYCGGLQENFTAQAGWKRRGLKLATKWYPNTQGAHRADVIRTKIAESLKELETDSVDIYYLHAADRTTPFQETLQAVNEAYKQGKFKTFGISNFTASEVAEVCLTCKYNGWVRPTVYQGAYNCLNRTPEYDLLPTLRRFGLDWVVYNPLAGGLLTGRHMSKDDTPGGRFSEESGTLGTMYRARYWNDATFDALKLIDQAAKRNDLTMTEVALRWLVHHSALKLPIDGGNDGILVGASSLEQLKENIENLEKGPLPDDVVDACVSAWELMIGSRPIYYHGDYSYSYDTVEAIFGKGAL